MRTLYKVEGAQFRIEILETPKMRDFIEAHAAALDSSFEQVAMSDTMRKRLQRSDYIFSGPGMPCNSLIYFILSQIMIP